MSICQGLYAKIIEQNKKFKRISKVIESCLKKYNCQIKNKKNKILGFILPIWVSI